MQKIIHLLSFFALFHSGSTLAALITFSSSADFLTQTSGLEQEGFESTATFSTRTDQVDFSLFTAQSAIPNLSLFGSSSGDMFATEGSNYLRNQSFSGAITLSFNSAINAFALDLAGWGVNRNGTLTLSNELGDSVLISTGARTRGETLFFGVLSDQAFQQITLTSTTSRDSWAMDNLYFGMNSTNSTVTTASVAEPSGLWLMLIGLAGLSLRRQNSFLREKHCV